MSFGLLVALIFGYFILGTITLRVYHVVDGYEDGGIVIVLLWPFVWIIAIFLVIYRLTYKLASFIEEKYETKLE